MPSLLAGNVYRGIVRLMEEDKEFFLKIDPESFSIQNLYWCAVGQYYRHQFDYDPYRKGLRLLGIDEVDAFLYGYDAFDDFDDKCDSETVAYRIKVLNRMWRYALNEMCERDACMKRHPSYKG